MARHGRPTVHVKSIIHIYIKPAFMKKAGFFDFWPFDFKFFLSSNKL
ncbi:hypothetical protein SAMN05421639_103373 [Chryseobacterium shigense]|uniref:Uncharacterized protein n=1 Tax=Chryseobacterium shigense TaxID=297244 RepID=A0A1N7IF20_9FLAO|nr:hypothetical protein SAMN05421639_103373 [Chryseobacterium shigense]